MPTPPIVTHPMSNDRRDPPVLTRVPLPIPARADPMEQLLCSDVISRAIDKWGMPAVARCIQCELAARGLDTWSLTIDALAQGEEVQ